MPAVGAAAIAAFGGGIGGAVFGVGTIAAVALNAGLYVGGTLLLGEISKRLGPHPSSTKPQQPDIAVTRRGTAEPRDIVYGEATKGGFMTFFGTAASPISPTDYYVEVLAFAGHQIDQYLTFYFDDRAVDVASEINNSGFVTNSKFLDSAGSSMLVIQMYEGRQTTADAMTRSLFPNVWTTEHVGRGVAYCVFRYQRDRSKGGTDPEHPERNVWAGGLPQRVTARLRGKRVCDTRLGQTYTSSGGWTWSNNAELCANDYARWSYGLNIPSSRFDDDHIEASADTCDDSQTVWGANVGSLDTQARWTVNGVLSMGESRADNMQALLDSMQGRITYTQGVYRLHPAVWETPTATVDDTWLRSLRVRTATRRRDVANVVRGVYRDINRHGQEVPYLARINSDSVNSMGLKIEKVADFPLINDEYQAQRAALTRLKHSAPLDMQRVWEATLHKRGFELAPWQTVFLNANSFGVASGTTARVTKMSVTPQGDLRAFFEADASSAYTYVSTMELSQITSVGLIIPRSDCPPRPSNLQARSVPNGIHWTWTKGDPDQVRATELWVNKTNSRGGSGLKIAVSDAGEDFIQNSLDNGQVFYGWVLSRGWNNLVSSFYPTDGVDGVVGVAGVATVTQNFTLAVKTVQNSQTNAWVRVTAQTITLSTTASLIKLTGSYPSGPLNVDAKFGYFGNVDPGAFRWRIRRELTLAASGTGPVIATFPSDNGTYINAEAGDQNIRGISESLIDYVNSGFGSYDYIIDASCDPSLLSGINNGSVRLIDIYLNVQYHSVEP